MLLLLGFSQDVFYGHAHGRAACACLFRTNAFYNAPQSCTAKPCLDVYQDALVLRLKIAAIAIDRFFLASVFICPQG
jgi:hypothetical protein